MTGLEVRPVRSADRARVTEMVTRVWDGHDYIPRVFDDWVADPGAWFQAGELGGEVVGVQRLRPIAPKVVWYEGLRVAPEQQRRGVARAMLEAAVAQTRGLGFEEIRLASANPDAIALFRSAGFELLVDPRLWRGRRLEGDEPARMPSPADAGRLFAQLREDPALETYGRVFAQGEWALDASAELVGRLAAEGALRVTAGGRALAAVREGWGGDSLWAYFVSGSGAALHDLLLALRFEADTAGLSAVNLWAPEGHPGEDEFRATGYDSDSEPFRLSYFALRISN
ncbi:MAG TPA: GNAT family N-acetyltransferase [Candidatus Dormibacteraeota bacterium]|nr:GNAT family N-acetyltransferase [Candidatus Dormibacteraeota bacterium]